MMVLLRLGGWDSMLRPLTVIGSTGQTNGCQTKCYLRPLDPRLSLGYSELLSTYVGSIERLGNESGHNAWMFNYVVGNELMGGDG